MDTNNGNEYGYEHEHPYASHDLALPTHFRPTSTRTKSKSTLANRSQASQTTASASADEDEDDDQRATSRFCPSCNDEFVLVLVFRLTSLLPPPSSLPLPRAFLLPVPLFRCFLLPIPLPIQLSPLFFSSSSSSFFFLLLLPFLSFPSSLPFCNLTNPTTFPLKSEFRIDIPFLSHLPPNRLIGHEESTHPPSPQAELS